MDCRATAMLLGHGEKEKEWKTYFCERERTPSGAVLGLERLWRNDPFAPADLVKVHRQFPPLAEGSAHIFRNVQSGVVDVLLSSPREITLSVMPRAQQQKAFFYDNNDMRLKEKRLF